MKRTLKVGFFSKGSARVVEPPRIEYKGFKYKFSIKGDLNKQVLVRSKKKISSLDGRSFWINNNSSVSIKLKQNLRSKFVNGPTVRLTHRRKLSSLFTYVI